MLLFIILFSIDGLFSSVILPMISLTPELWTWLACHSGGAGFN